MLDLVTFFDLASKPPCKGWTPNPWKTRILLNFKGIPYKTEWMEYPDLEPKFKELSVACGIPPNPPGSFSDYSSPAVRLADGTYLMDSMNIAKAIDKIYPEPSCHLDTGLQDEVEGILPKIARPIFAVIVPSIMANILQEPSYTWCKADRERRFGMSLEEFHEKLGGESAWEAMEPGMLELMKLLTERKRDAGPFILGSTTTYADLIIGAFFEGMLRMGPSSYPRLIAYDESFGKIHEACRPWLLRDDH